MGFTLFALTAAATATLGAVTLGGLIGGRVRLARRAGLLAGSLAVAYVGVLAAVNASSSARVLRPGEREALCGAYLDCHIEVSVTRSEPASPYSPTRIVTLELSSTARAATITPPALAIRLVGRDGRAYDRDLAAEDRLGLDAALDRPLEPGTKRSVRLAFNVPEGASAPRLRVQLANPVARVVEGALVGDTDGLFHAPVLHSLDA